MAAPARTMRTGSAVMSSRQSRPPGRRPTPDSVAVTRPAMWGETPKRPGSSSWPGTVIPLAASYASRASPAAPAQAFISSAERMTAVTPPPRAGFTVSPVPGAGTGCPPPAGAIPPVHSGRLNLGGCPAVRRTMSTQDSRPTEDPALCDHAFTTRGAVPGRVLGGAWIEPYAYRECPPCGTRKPESSLTGGERHRADVMTFRAQAESEFGMGMTEAAAVLATGYGVDPGEAARYAREALLRPQMVPVPDGAAPGAGADWLRVWSSENAGNRAWRVALMPDCPGPDLVYEHHAFGGGEHWFSARIPVSEIGYAQVQERQAPAGPHAEIVRLWVSPHDRGQGIGTRLIENVAAAFPRSPVRLAVPSSLEGTASRTAGDLAGYWAARGFLPCHSGPGSPRELHGYVERPPGGAPTGPARQDPARRGPGIRPRTATHDDGTRARTGH